MNTVFDTKLNRRYSLIDGRYDFKMKKIRVCDCFLDSTIYFSSQIYFVDHLDEMRELFNKIIYTSVRSPIQIFTLFAESSVICCNDALYQFDYMDFVSFDKLAMFCKCDVPRIDGLRSCAFYLEENLIEFNDLCFSCASTRFTKLENICYTHSV